MDNIIRQPASGPIQLQSSLVRPITDNRIMLSVFSHMDAEPSVKIMAGRPDCHRHIHQPPTDSRKIDLSADQNIPMGYPLPPVFLQFPDRHLEKPSIPNRQFPRNRHLAKPTAIVGLCAYRIPVLHPANHNPASIRGKKCLRSIKIQTIINGLHLFSNKPFSLRVIISNQAERPMSGMKFQADSNHLLRAGKKHLTAIQRKEIRTFPHFPVLVSAGIQNPDKFPIYRVPTPIEQNHTAAV